MMKSNLPISKEKLGGWNFEGGHRDVNYLQQDQRLENVGAGFAKKRQAANR
jgi:hypothetical protein